MAADPNPALRAELEAALHDLVPQITGLHLLENVSVSFGASEAFSSSILAEINLRERRREKIRAALKGLDEAWASLNVLEADGYPTIPTAVIDTYQFAELKAEIDNLMVAFSVFHADAAASRLRIDLGNPTEKIGA